MNSISSRIIAALLGAIILTGCSSDTQADGTAAQAQTGTATDSSGDGVTATPGQGADAAGGGAGPSAAAPGEARKMASARVADHAAHLQHLARKKFARR